MSCPFLVTYSSTPKTIVRSLGHGGLNGVLRLWCLWSEQAGPPESSGKDQANVATLPTENSLWL